VYTRPRPIKMQGPGGSLSYVVVLPNNS